MKVLGWLFGCRHKQISFPIDMGGGPRVVCLTCGKEWAYCWESMKVVKDG
jgi:hypothetical protein